MTYRIWLSMIEKRGENLRHDALERHHRRVRRRPLQADDVRHVDQTLDERARQPEAGPERVVDDEPDVGCLGAGEDVVEEVALGVGVVERRRDLDVVRPDRGRGLHEPDQLERARRLAADRDRYATGGRRDDSLPDRHALIERHRREVARRPAREEDRGARHAPAVDEELHVPRDRIEVQREFRDRRGTSSGS